VTEKGHGRLETRVTRVYALEEAGEAGLFQAATLVVTERRREVLKTGKATLESAYHLGTAEAGSRDAAGWAGAVRAHWGIENGNHWRRDACLLEDKTPGKNPGVVGNLAVSRAVLLFYNATEGGGNIHRCVQDVHHRPDTVFCWLTSEN
jgi:hypothetical protein